MSNVNFRPRYSENNFFLVGGDGIARALRQPRLRWDAQEDDKMNVIPLANPKVGFAEQVRTVMNRLRRTKEFSRERISCFN
jgi:hypothetical protein